MHSPYLRIGHNFKTFSKSGGKILKCTKAAEIVFASHLKRQLQSPPINDIFDEIIRLQITYINWCIMAYTRPHNFGS